METASLKFWCFSHHSPTVLLRPSPTEQFDIHRPAVEMACSHTKQRPFVSVLLLGGWSLPPTPQISTIFFLFLLPTFCFSLTFTLFGYWCWAPFNSSSTHNRSVSGYFLPLRFETQIFFFFFWHSQAVENETFTIRLGCKFELRDPKQWGHAAFIRQTHGE